MKGKKILIADNIFKTIAKKEGTSVEQVKQSIRTAVFIGLNNPDQQVAQYWKCIPCKSDSPTPEEVVLFLAQELSKYKPILQSYAHHQK